MGKKEDAELYYKEFMKYWIETYNNLYLWIVDVKQWVEYEKGVFKFIPQEKINKIVFDILKAHHVVLDSRKVNVILNLLKAEYWKNLTDFDCNRNIRNFRNGLYYVKEKELKKHSKFILSLVQLPLTLGDKEKETPYWDRVRNEYPAQLLLLERFLHSIFLGDMDNELHVYIYGASGSGKGTVTNVIKEMFKGAISFTPIDTIGKPFGLSSLIGNRVNLDPEMNISYFDSTTVSKIKTIVGRDGMVEINIKGVKQFEYEFSEMYFISATNQLPKLPPTDVKAWFRRVLLFHFDKTQPRDVEMKNGILEEINDIFTNIMLSDYRLIFDEYTDVDNWVQVIQEEWEDSCYPVHKIIRDNFVKTDNINNRIKSDDILSWTEGKLADGGYGIPRQKTLQAIIKKELHKLKIEWKRGDKYGSYYYCVKTTSEDLQNQIDMIVVSEILDSIVPEDKELIGLEKY